MGAVPLGTLDHNGRPFGISVVARMHHEHKLIDVMGAS